MWSHDDDFENKAARIGFEDAVKEIIENLKSTSFSTFSFQKSWKHVITEKAGLHHFSIESGDKLFIPSLS